MSYCNYLRKWKGLKEERHERNVGARGYNKDTKYGFIKISFYNTVPCIMNVHNEQYRNNL